ncbi:hypothetical protein HPB50_003105 [Hyalomma asiaticum]|uniref:Uncharacterized protein n=1 Tax=Hyalomma asiaticum TaxID=266040 RepID=A0ACB7TE70_HYAAI|nr:hypothetical protein HPB50_003105 [Hyalomma asiaticum]
MKATHRMGPFALLVALLVVQLAVSPVSSGLWELADRPPSPKRALGFFFAQSVNQEPPEGAARLVSYRPKSRPLRWG